MRQRLHGFTLIELSIVLVIIALVVGGIIGGKALIRSAEIQQAITESNTYKTALNNFELQYDALPGDMRDAEDYFGASNTNNGDGNGQWNTAIDEGLRTWEHLSLANFIDGTYRGPPLQYDTGVTLPESPFGTRWYAYNTTYILWGITHYSGRAIAIANGDNNIHWHVGMTVEDTITLDKKIDDGSPYNGKVFAANNGTVDCTGTPAVGYLKANTGWGCQVIFALD